MYTPRSAPWAQEAQIIRRDLAPLGIDVQVKEFAVGDYFARIGRPGEPFDLAISGYTMPPDPLGALTPFDGSNIGNERRQPLVLQRPGLQPEAPGGGEAVRREPESGSKPPRARARARRRSRGGDRDEREP